MSLTPHILILAAGKGKRMKSDLPKVLHEVLFQPMIHHVLDLASALPHSSVSVVVGHGGEEVKSACGGYPLVQFVDQKEQRGTADAVKSAETFLSKQSGSVLVLSGDVPLLRKESIQKLLDRHEKQNAVCSLVSTRLQNPKGYGRILRDSSEAVYGIREEADASESEKKITEVNAGIYCFEIKELFDALSKVSNQNRQGEFYLTDAIEILVREKKKVIGVLFEDSEETLGINDRIALAQAEKVLQKRVNQFHMENGVTLQGNDDIWIDTHSEIASDVVIESGCRIFKSKIGGASRIEAQSRVQDSVLGSRVKIKQGSVIEESKIGHETTVGPYAHLRPGSILGSQVKIGNFVEVKKSSFKDGAKASHLSYIGDAEIGKDVNLGCGFITCNYDGVKKHKTVIEDGVFVGSDSQMIAPVTLGAGSYVASGTTVTRDVPPESLVISRGKQVTKLGYAKKFLKKK
ncbi:MAG: bifunctional UDP-N-acetylglucosamine diphosphorylase/glucosamine-1-phosphate N-acetyltransferase GlmU [Deltaproteobacteria bacterium]